MYDLKTNIKLVSCVVEQQPIELLYMGHSAQTTFYTKPKCSCTLENVTESYRQKLFDLEFRYIKLFGVYINYMYREERVEPLENGRFRYYFVTVADCTVNYIELTEYLDPNEYTK